MANFSAIAIIYNPHSTGDAPGNARRLKAGLKTALSDIPVKLLHTKYTGHARQLAYDFAKAHHNPLIISASGDGGYNEVVNGALQAQKDGYKPICAVLPSGNANDHARTMQRRPLLELIVRDHVRRLDVLRITTRHSHENPLDRYAHSYVGIGFTPKVAQELNKNTLNTLKVCWIVIRSFWGLRPVRIQRNGRTETVDSLICSVIPEMARILTLSRNATPRDGLFEVTIIRHRSRLWLLLQLIKGTVVHFGADRRADSLIFTLLQPSPVQLDGEIVQLPKHTEVTVSIEPRLLRTLV